MDASRHRRQGTQNAETPSEESKYVIRLGKDKQQENINEMLAREDDLIFVSPILEGFALKNKLWRMSF
jgi:hypothetical protein